MTETPKKTAINTRLRAAREQAGLSQAQSAKIMKMHRPTISEIEAGRRKVSSEEVMSFAKIYGVSIDWLMGGETSDENVQASVRMAARELSRLKKEDLDKILELISTLKSTGRDQDES